MIVSVGELIDGELHGLVAPPFAIYEAGHTKAHVGLDFGFLNGVPVSWGAIDEVQAFIHHGIGALIAGVEDSLGAFGVRVEHVRQEGARDRETIRAQQGTAHVGDGFPTGEAFQDARPAALVSDLLLHEAFNRFGGQKGPLRETPLV